MNEWIQGFWDFADNPNHTRLECLKIASELQWHMIPSKKTLKVLRWRFNTDHVVRKKYPLASSCWSCGYRKGEGDYFLVRHHIISLGNGGCNRRINIVTICSDCHACIHPWLNRTN